MKRLLEGKKIVVLGCAKSGEATARWAFKQGAKVVISDLKPLSAWQEGLVSWAKQAGIVLDAGGHHLGLWQDAELIVVSPGIPLDIEPLQLMREKRVKVVGELFLAASLWHGRLAGITGTNGKTTTTKLVGDMCKQAGLDVVVAGNIGKPFIEAVDECGDGKTPEDKIAVLELSSFQLEGFEGSPIFPSWHLPCFEVVAWLNLAADHLDRYSGMEAYGDAKARLMEFQSEKDRVILNRDCKLLENWDEKAKAERLYFGRKNKEGKEEVGAWFAEVDRDLMVKIDGLQEHYDLSKWELKGVHNLENLAAGVLVAKCLGVKKDAIEKVIATFKAPHHRIEFVAEKQGVAFYDDSKATNVGSVLTALQAMDRQVVLIAGGRGKGEDYFALGAPDILEKIKAVVVIGEEAEGLERVFSSHIPVVRLGADVVSTVGMTNSVDHGWQVMDLAVKKASELAEAGDVVLLSPACASFDLFRNYEERGKAFKKAVLDL